MPFALCLLFLPAVAQTLPPAPIRPKIQTACAECHDASILVQQRLSSAAWTKEVDKMIRWGALVDPRDREAFIRYFSDHFGPDKPPYTPPAPRRATPRPKR